MQVKWGWIRPGSLMTTDHGVIATAASGKVGNKMWSYDAVSGPKGDGTNGYPMPKDHDIIIIGGRSSIAEAMGKHGPLGWHCKTMLWSFGVYRKSGSFRDPNLTLLVLTGNPHARYPGMKHGPTGDIKFQPNNVDPERYFLPPNELRTFVKDL